MRTDQWALVISLLTPLGGLILFGLHQLSNRNFSAAKFKAVVEDTQTSKAAIVNLSEAAIAQKGINRINEKLGDQVAALQREFDQMVGREDARDRRDAR